MASVMGPPRDIPCPQCGSIMRRERTTLVCMQCPQHFDRCGAVHADSQSWCDSYVGHAPPCCDHEGVPFDEIKTYPTWVRI